VNAPKYVQRIARLPEVFEHVMAHPDGIPLRELADHFGVPADQLREDLLAFYTADVTPDLLMGLTRPSVLEFLSPEGDDADPADAEVVRISDPANAGELGVEYVDASELALIYTAAHSLLEMEPDNTELAAAVDALAETMLGAASDAEQEAAVPWNKTLQPIIEGQRQQRRVDIVYSRAWEPGVTERSIEPYRLVKTRRGWEVDAGPLDADGEMRTFLVSNIRDARLTTDAFTMPAELPSLLQAKRATTRVQVELAQSARWAADMYAERVQVVEDREDSVVMDVELLPPLEHRLGLLLLASRSGARVVDPAELGTCEAELARRLLEHHRPEL
jgi:proteasome accessory factor C